MSAACARIVRRLLAAERGTSLTEFAIGLPVMLTVGGYGLEIANLSLTHMRVSQIALTLADNASRIGVNSGLASYQVQEADLDDILQGARLLGQGINLAAQGRVTISSLEYKQQSYDQKPVERIHWQRCIGAKTGSGWDSSYGAATPLTTAGTDPTSGNAGTASSGMGPAPVVSPPSDSALMFVEVNYQYTPLFGTMFLPATRTKIHYIASFINRDRRDYSQLWNRASPLGTTAPRMTCDVSRP